MEHDALWGEGRVGVRSRINKAHQVASDTLGNLSFFLHAFAPGTIGHLNLPSSVFARYGAVHGGISATRVRNLPVSLSSNCSAGPGDRAL